jgi:hypothetical protein
VDAASAPAGAAEVSEGAGEARAAAGGGPAAAREVDRASAAAPAEAGAAKAVVRERRWKMPGGDRTGPLGEGPMTGRGLGSCGGGAGAGFAGPGARMGLGRGRGFRGGRFGRGGFGWRNRFRATGAPGWARGWGGGWAGPDAERQWLAGQTRALEEELEQLRRRLGELEARDRREAE